MTEKHEVRSFWESEACGERYGLDQDRLRYQLEPEIIAFIDSIHAEGKRVLEIGIGMGADFLRWVRAGAQASGVDLTERAVAITRQRLLDEGLSANTQVADAEHLPFEDDQFDIVYSWGVIHHTPHPAAALSEVQRVLAPGGALKLMLYHRHSWVALAAWVRHCLLRGRPWQGLRQAVAHLESPGTQAFTPAEIRRMLPRVSNLTIRPTLTHWDRRWAPGISNLLGHRLGWFLLVEGGKPTVPDPLLAPEAEIRGCR